MLLQHTVCTQIILFCIFSIKGAISLKLFKIFLEGGSQTTKTSQYKSIRTTHVHAQHMNTCGTHMHMYITHVPYRSTCALHDYIHTTWVHVHYTSTCALHTHMRTTHAHAHYTRTCVLHEYIRIACVRPCIIPLVTQDTNTRWITCDTVILQPQ